MAEIDRYEAEAYFHEALFDKVDNVPLYQKYAKKASIPLSKHISFFLNNE